MRLSTLILASFSIPLLAASSAPPVHLEQAEEIAHQIDQSHNEYAHKDCFIHWKGEAGATTFENRTDCSDFLNLLLVHAYRLSDAQMEKWTSRSRPLAETWFGVIERGQGFQKIQTIDHVQPGDVIAIKYPPGQGDTGHIMIVASQPKRRTATPPLEQGSTQWELNVVDSSKSGHGTSDTRRESNGTFHTGVGEGTIRMYADASGNIIGYAWSTGAVSKYESGTERKIAVGRLQLP